MRAAIAVVLVALPALAAANPITIGVSAGASESKLDASSGLGATRTFGLYGRLGFGRYVSGQLEVAKLDSSQPQVTIRNATALLVVDLMSQSTIVPVLLAGIGIDNATGPFSLNVDAHHTEGGLGLELRSRGGFTLGADVRIGTRTIDSQTMANIDTFLTPITLREGEYRTARLTIGATF